MNPVVIDNTLTVGSGRTVIIAEVGINHNGDVTMAKDMIASAWDNGADLVKLQSFSTERFFAKDVPYFNSTKSLELSPEEHEILFSFAKEKGIRLFTTPFDLDTLRFLDRYDMPAYKIASMDCNNYQLIKASADRLKPVILSTGMSQPDEVTTAINVIKESGNYRIVLMHCVSDYPASCSDMNMRFIYTLRDQFNIPCGISDHTKGMDIAYLAVGMGADIIEKHFTFNKDDTDRFPHADHDISMTPEELKKLSVFCKNAEIAKGDGNYRLTENEKGGRLKFRRGIYAKRDIREGEKFSEENTISLRPVKGIPVSMMDKIIGKTALKGTAKGEPIMIEGVKI